jgi:hypothetical protein
MSHDEGTGLIVPINVVAFCVGETDYQEATNNFAGATTNYANMTPESEAFLGLDVAIGLDKPPLNQLKKGIHLHWALPDALTKSSAVDGKLEFKAIPNRWLLTRIYNDNKELKVKSWIIESDALNEKKPDRHYPVTVPVVPVKKSDGNQQHYLYLGQWHELESDLHLSGSNYRKTAGGDLTAVSSGDISFAAYYPNCSSVLGFWDGLEDLQVKNEDPVHLMYVVTGWYDAPSNDPLRSDLFKDASNNGIDRSSLEENLKWTFRTDRDEDPIKPAFSVYSGLVENIAWNPHTNYIYRQTCQNQINAKVAMGNNPVEAISAFLMEFINSKTGPIEPLLNAFQMDLLDGFREPQPNIMKKIYSSLHEKQFSTLDSGTIYAIVRKEDESTEEDPCRSEDEQSGKSSVVSRDDAGIEEDREELIELPPRLADDLSRLNLQQQKSDQYGSRLKEYRWQLFSDWCRIFMAQDIKTKNDALNKASDQCQLHDEYNTTYEGILDEVNKQKKVVCDQRGDDLRLKILPAPRYYQPAEPVVLIAAEKGKSSDLLYPSRYGGYDQFHPDGYLPGRLANDVLTEVVVNGKTVNVSDFKDLVLPSSISLIYPEICTSLLKEACMLNPSLMAALKLIEGTEISTIISALKDLLRGVSQSIYKAVGQVPSRIAVTFWEDNDGAGSNPWLPIFLRWEAGYLPVYPVGERKDTKDYESDFFLKNFEIDIDRGGSVVYNPRESEGRIDPSCAQFVQFFKGETLLQTSAVEILKKKLDEYLKDNEEKSKENEIFEKIHSVLDKYDILVQPLTGLAYALIMRRLSLQFSITAPKGSLYYKITEDIARIVGDENRIGPQFNGHFNPIRAGWLNLKEETSQDINHKSPNNIGLQVVDVFGQKRGIDFDKIICAQSMIARDANQKHLLPMAYLEPRISQPGRLLFRWISADSLGYEEMNSHPATSPICGWLLPNHLNGGLFLYNQQGKPLGSLYLSGDKKKVMWQSSPGDDLTINMDISAVLRCENPQLSKLAISLKNSPIDHFNDFCEAIDMAHGSINPQYLSSSSCIAPLIGRPIAVVQALLRLEVEGTPALNQGFHCFIQDKETENNFTGVKFPVILGDIARLDDGLIGYFKLGSNKQDFDLSTFYVEGASSSLDSGVVPPGRANLLLTATPKKETPDQTYSPENFSEKVLMLVDPWASVHAISGIMPIKSLELPSDQVDSALSTLEMSFPVTPILEGKTRLTMPLPQEDGYQLSWIEENRRGKKVGGIEEESEWDVRADIESQSGNAIWDYTPQRITEGWLRMNPMLLEFEMSNADGLPVVTKRIANSLMLRIANKKHDTVSFAPGEVVCEGEPKKGSIFYIHLGDLVSQKDIDKVRLSTDDGRWRFEVIQNLKYGVYWAAVPAKEFSLKGKESTDISVESLLISAIGSQAKIYFDYYCIEGLNDGVGSELLTIIE